MSTIVIVGIDEAGRGPLAGPVVAGACHIPLPVFGRRKPYGAWSPFARKRTPDIIIADSKALGEDGREIAYAWITEHCAWGIGMSSQEEIDAYGILQATENAMQQALAMVAERITPTYVLVDGNDKFWFDYPHSSVVRGDDKEPTIAAASILAKVTRDRLMLECATDFPQYGFERHKGYGSEEHIAAIKTHGPCALHRKSFLRNIVQEESQTVSS
ncbi:MAG TPA: ribonuclease HII [Candidatus Peribacteraceae bacterium]|nr:ribonuclease HII [Candidatus Peribacteraceae bacterium]